MTQVSPPTRSKARSSLVAAFNQLVLEKPYAEFHVADVIRLADVSRSTFYEHFRSKDDILKSCLTHVLGPSAAAGFPVCNHDELRWVLNHFLEVEDLARIYLSGPVGSIVTERLAELIEPMLEAEREQTSGLSNVLLATQMAAAAVGLLAGWFNQDPKQDVEHIANQLHQTASALARC